MYPDRCYLDDNCAVYYVYTHTYCIYSTYERQLYFLHVCAGSSPHVIYLWNTHFYIVHISSALQRGESDLTPEIAPGFGSWCLRLSKYVRKSAQKSLGEKTSTVFKIQHILVNWKYFLPKLNTNQYKKRELEAEGEEDMVKVKVKQEPLFLMSFRMVTYVPNHGLTMRETGQSPNLMQAVS